MLLSLMSSLTNDAHKRQSPVAGIMPKGGSGLAGRRVGTPLAECLESGSTSVGWTWYLARLNRGGFSALAPSDSSFRGDRGNDIRELETDVVC